MSYTADFTLAFNSKQEYREAVLCAVALVEEIQTTAHFPSVSITPNWSSGRVEIKIPIGAPLHHARMQQLVDVCRPHGCEYFVKTHNPGGEFFAPYIEVIRLADDGNDQQPGGER